MAIKIEIGKDGCCSMLWDDAVDLRKYGEVEVTRASHVEFNNGVGQWFVQSARTGYILKDDFKSRAAALAWEKEYYSPGGKGWAELKGE